MPTKNSPQEIVKFIFPPIETAPNSHTRIFSFRHPTVHFEESQGASEISVGHLASIIYATTSIMVEAKAPEGTEPKTEKCNGCGEIFPSRNAVFKHLKETDGACLSADDYKNFVRYVRKAVKPPKVVLLYGYLPYKGCSNSSEDTSETLKKDAPIIRNGQDAGNILIETIQQLQNEIDGLDDDDDDDSDGDIKNPSSVNKVNRSYGHFSRSAECVQQDMDTGAVTEVMTMRLYALRAGMSMDDWLGRVQQKLDEKFELKDNAMTDSDSRRVTPIRILGRQDMPNKKFNAEMDVSVFSPIFYMRNAQ